MSTERYQVGPETAAATAGLTKDQLVEFIDRLLMAVGSTHVEDLTRIRARVQRETEFRAYDDLNLRADSTRARAQPMRKNGEPCGGAAREYLYLMQEADRSRELAEAHFKEAERISREGMRQPEQGAS